MGRPRAGDRDNRRHQLAQSGAVAAPMASLSSRAPKKETLPHVCDHLKHVLLRCVQMKGFPSAPRRQQFPSQHATVELGKLAAAVSGESEIPMHRRHMFVVPVMLRPKHVPSVAIFS